jgi:hypothetical protein
MASTVAPSPTVLDVLINEMQVSRVDLAQARAAFERSPNLERETALREARGHMDALLDAYFDPAA